MTRTSIPARLATIAVAAAFAQARSKRAIPCDPPQMGEFAMPFALLSEARDPSRIAVGAIVITADDEEPVR